MLTLLALSSLAYAQDLRIEAVVTGPAFPTGTTLPVLAVETGVSTAYTITGSGGGGAGNPSGAPLVLRRTPDAASAVWPGALDGQAYRLEIRAFEDTLQGGELLRYVIVAPIAGVAQIDTDLSVSGAPIESISFSPECLQTTVNAYDPVGTPTGSTTFAWSFAFNQPGCE